MRAITLTQPWATLVAIGAKTIETRSWRIWHHGPLAIHAGKGLADMTKKEFFRLCQSEPFASCLGPALMGPTWQPGDYIDPNVLPRGEIVAVCNLVDCYRTEIVTGWKGALTLTDQERAFGNYEPGRYGWLLEDIQQLVPPVPAKGELGLWDWHPSKDLAKALGVAA